MPFEIIVTFDNHKGIAKDTPLEIPYLCSHKIFRNLVTTTEDPMKYNAILMGTSTWDILHAHPNYEKISGKCLEVLLKKGALPDHLKNLNICFERSFTKVIKILENMPEIEKIFIIGGPSIFSTAYKSQNWTEIHIIHFIGNLEATEFFPTIATDLGVEDRTEETRYKLKDHIFETWKWHRTAPLAGQVAVTESKK